jgi:formylmethanofuran dehydrogenase subunit E-like metal-binding protein
VWQSGRLTLSERIYQNMLSNVREMERNQWKNDGIVTWNNEFDRLTRNEINAIITAFDSEVKYQVSLLAPPGKR